jgi:hypothetical protein
LPCQDAIKQQEWKIDRLTRDNRALEATNCELRRRMEETRAENLQVGAQRAAAQGTAVRVQKGLECA